MINDIKDRFIAIKHEGRRPERCNNNPLEKIFAEEWQELNGSEGRRYGVLEYLLAEDPNHPRGEMSQRDATVAATVIQWLGSSVGLCFLEGVSERAHLPLKHLSKAVSEQY